jgi:hypothetical protein
MADQFAFFVGGHVFGVGCGPFLVDSWRQAKAMKKMITGAYPGEDVTIFQLIGPELEACLDDATKAETA